MNITKTMNGTTLNVALEGRLDTTTAPELEQALKYDMENATELTMDFGKLDYISSAGLRVLLIMHKACAGGVTLCGANEVVTEILSQTGFDSILNIVEAH